MAIRTVILASAAALALSAGAASAQGLFGGGGAHGSYYLKGFGGATWPQDQSGDLREFGTVVVDGDADYDTGYVLGLAFGFEFTPNVSMELEYAYRSADTDTSFDGVGPFGGDTTSNAVMLNGLYKFAGMGPNAAWQPYLGGGLGWANAESDIDDIGNFKREDAFAYQVIAGVGFDITPQWMLQGELRWFGTDEGRYEGPDGLSWEASFETIDLLIGATYTFQP